MPGLSTCRSCGAAIHWLKRVKKEVDGYGRLVTVPVPGAKANPIDAKPHRDGKLVIDPANERYRFATGNELELARNLGKRLYISHFETCPYADRHRSR